MDVMFDQVLNVERQDLPVTLPFANVIFVMEDVDAASPIVRSRSRDADKLRRKNRKEKEKRKRKSKKSKMKVKDKRKRDKEKEKKKKESSKRGNRADDIDTSGDAETNAQVWHAALYGYVHISCSGAQYCCT